VKRKAGAETAENAEKRGRKRESMQERAGESESHKTKYIEKKSEREKYSRKTKKSRRSIYIYSIVRECSSSIVSIYETTHVISSRRECRNADLYSGVSV